MKECRFLWAHLFNYGKIKHDIASGRVYKPQNTILCFSRSQLGALSYTLILEEKRDFMFEVCQKGRNINAYRGNFY